MRDFATYLKKTNEARQAAPPPEPPQARGAGPFIKQMLQDLKGEIEQIQQHLPAQIQQLVDELKSRLKGPGVTAHRGIGTRIANWWRNLWQGADNPANPYYMRNKLGAWGGRVAESAEDRILSIAEYRTVTELTTLLEAGLAGQPVYQIDRVLDQWGDRATDIIMRYIQDMNRHVQMALNAGANFMDPGQPPEGPKPPPEGPKQPPAPEGPKPPPEGPKPPPEGPKPPPEGPKSPGLKEPPAPEEAPEEEGEEEAVPTRRSDGVSPASHEEMGRHGGAEQEEERPRAGMPEEEPRSAGLHSPPASFTPEEEPEPEPEEEPGAMPTPKRPPRRKPAEEAPEGPVPEFPVNMPERAKGESAKDFNSRLWAWVKAAFAHFKAKGMVNKQGAIKMSSKSSDKSAGNMVRPDDLYELLRDRSDSSDPRTTAPPAEVPEGPEEEEGVPGPSPEEAPEHAAATARSERHSDILSDANRQHVIDTLKALRKRHRHTLTDEQREVLDAVWHPWMALPQGQKDHFNRLGNAGKKGRSHNPGHLRVVLPKVLRKGDPRIDIIKRYYPDIYDEYMSEHAPELSRIEKEGESEESVQQRIERHFQRRPPRSKKKESGGEDLSAQIDALAEKGHLKPDEVAELKRGLEAGQSDDVRTLLDIAGRTGAGDKEGELSDLIKGLEKFPETTELIARYLQLLREGHKPILRSEYIHLPVSQRHEYFKKLLASD